MDWPLRPGDDPLSYPFDPDEVHDGIWPYPFDPDEVHDLIPFPQWGPWPYSLDPDQVHYLIPFILMRSIILSSSSWWGPLSYPLHPDEVHYPIPFILMRSIILSPSSWWGQLRTCRLSQTGSPLVKYSHVQTTTDSGSTQNRQISTSWQKHIYVQTTTKGGLTQNMQIFTVGALLMKHAYVSLPQQKVV